MEPPFIHAPSRRSLRMANEMGCLGARTVAKALAD
jgi:hypothetical protein